MASPMDFSSDFPDVGQFCKVAVQSTVEAIQSCNELPTMDDISTSSAKIRKVIACQSQRVLKLISRIMKHQTIKRKIESLDLEEKLDLLSDTNELIMEKIGTALDEASGRKKKDIPTLALVNINSKDLIKTSWNKNTLNKNSNYRLITAKNILRPQLKFTEKIDNSDQPFQPIIKEKPNSIRPLAIILEPTENGLMYSHPYHCELEHFHPLEKHLLAVQPQIPKSIQDTPLIYVDKVDQVKILLDDLSNQEEIAIDLEHHSYRSFQGITCLMQISTRNVDYIVDTLALRSDLQELNQVFTNPKIVKVLHGADRDVEWLQRDLGLYLVNMFDTGQASRVLNLSSCSLASLLRLYCKKTNVDKHFQLADWRIRPLPEEMIIYAREDTHYLLYIYDQMKNELLLRGNTNQNLLISVFDRSKQLCAKRYEKPYFHEDGHLDLYHKSKKAFNTRQMYALKELYKWRINTARSEDESVGYVLPNHMLLQIAEVLPREQEGISACCNPIPPLIRQQLNEIHRIILAARELPLIKIESHELRVNITRTRGDVDLDDPLFSPHDNYDVAAKHNIESHYDESSFRMKKPCISVLGEPVKQTGKLSRCDEIKEALLVDETPYQRYLAMKSTECDEKLNEEVNIEVKASSSSSTVKSSKQKNLSENKEREEDTPIRQSTKRSLEEEDKVGKKKFKNQVTLDEAFDYDKVTYTNFKNKGKQKTKGKKTFFDDKDKSRFKTLKKTRANCFRSITYSKK